MPWVFNATIEENSNRWVKTENSIRKQNWTHSFKKKHRNSLVMDESSWILNILVIANYEFNNIWETEEKCSQGPEKVINTKTEKNKNKSPKTKALLFTRNMQRYWH